VELIHTFAGWLVLVLVGGSVALVLVYLCAKDQSRRATEPASASVGEPKSAALAVGPAQDAGAQPKSPGTMVIGPAEPIVVQPPATELLIIGPSRQEALVFGPAKLVIIEPPQRAAWDDRGWAKRAQNGQDTYQGNYHVADRRSGHRRRFRGTIVVNKGEVLAYIADPPPELRRHPKHACFQLSHAHWFKVHWQHAARNVDDAILYIERVLDEAINRRRAA
jgi:hypothetical protein